MFFLNNNTKDLILSNTIQFCQGCEIKNVSKRSLGRREHGRQKEGVSTARHP